MNEARVYADGFERSFAEVKDTMCRREVRICSI